MPKKNSAPKAAKRKTSLSDLAYEKIKQLIVTAHFKPGEYMNESELCVKFGYTRRFHQIIAKASKNPVLSETLAGLHIRSVRFWSITWTDIQRLHDVYKEHLVILKKIKARDAKAGSLAMKRHIESLMKASLRSVS